MIFCSKKNLLIVFTAAAAVLAIFLADMFYEKSAQQKLFETISAYSEKRAISPDTRLSLLGLSLELQADGNFRRLIQGRVELQKVNRIYEMPRVGYIPIIGFIFEFKLNPDHLIVCEINYCGEWLIACGSLRQQ